MMHAQYTFGSGLRAKAGKGRPYSSRVHLVSEPRVSWGIGAGDGSHSEYDVPQCAPGTPTEKCTHEISGVVTPPGKDMRFEAEVLGVWGIEAASALEVEVAREGDGRSFPSTGELVRVHLVGAA